MGNSSSNQHLRPDTIGVLWNGNTTTVPQWLNIINTTQISQRYQRPVSSILLAMPHIGVLPAVFHERNSLPQHRDLEYTGSYSVWASTPSPVLDVMCASLNETELAPIVYDTWNDDVVDAFTWTDDLLRSRPTTTNITVVDEIFGWAKKDSDDMSDYPPVFPRYPGPNATVLNHTSASRTRSAIYVLGQGAYTNLQSNNDSAVLYPLCRLSLSISSRCSTLFTVSLEGDKAEVLGEERAEDMAYINTNTSAIPLQDVPSWGGVAATWAESVSLNSGLDGSDTATSKTLMQLQLIPAGPPTNNSNDQVR